MNVLLVLACSLFPLIFGWIIDNKHNLKDLDFDIFDKNSFDPGFYWSKTVPPPMRYTTFLPPPHESIATPESHSIITETPTPTTTSIPKSTTITPTPPSTTNIPTPPSLSTESPCPPDKSLHTKKDIKILIDYRVKTLSVYNNINSSYYSKAIAVRDKHMNDFNNFRSWYQNRPEHLKHNIEDIATLRRNLEAYAKNIANALHLYPQYLEEYQKKLKKTNKLLEKFNRYKIICENNCVRMDVYHMSRRSNFNGYYCSSIKELDQVITSDLTEFVNKTDTLMIDRLMHDDNIIAGKIDVLKNKLKDIALKEFGRTMYDLLSLQDEYHHFVEVLFKVNANSEVYLIKQTHLQIDKNYLDLEQLIENYGSYCRTCNAFSPQFLFLKIDNALGDKVEESKDLLNDLLNSTHEEILNSLNTNYSTIFKELDILLNNTNTMATNVTNFEPIQEEIAIMLKEQRTKFDELKTIASESTITKLLKLSSDSKGLLSKIIAEIKQLDQKSPLQRDATFYS